MRQPGERDRGGAWSRSRQTTARVLAAFAALAAAACAQHPISVERNGEVEQGAAHPAPEPAVADTDTSDADTTASDTDTPPAESVPVCQPAADAKPKPKPKPKVVKPAPKPVESSATTAPQVTALPAGGVVNADVKPFNEPVGSILGKKVQGPKGEDLGRVIDVLADTSGRVRAAIIDFGGFLGVGNRRIAVDWPLLRFEPGTGEGDKFLILSLSREQLQSAPEYRGESEHPQALLVPAAPAAAGQTADPKK